MHFLRRRGGYFHHQVSTLSTHSEVKPPSDTPDTTEIGLNSTPYVTLRENKPAVSRRTAAHPTSLTLPLEEHPPRKRIRSDTVAAHLDRSAQDMSTPPLLLGMNTLGKLQTTLSY